MTKQITIQRKGETRVIVLRQMAHDPQAIVGKKIHYGSGAMWTVVAVNSMPCN